MLKKVLPLLSLGLMCAAEAPSHTHHPHPEKSSKHAISSQAFHRDDVPLSYKYSSVHIYTTSKPEPPAKEHSHSTYNAAVPNYYNNDHHQSEDINQYRHYVPVETVVPQKPETQASAPLSYEVNDYEENSPSYQTNYAQPQPIVTSEPKQYYRPSYVQAPAKSEGYSQEASVVKIPSHNYLQYNQKQTLQTRPTHNYLPVSLYQPHQQVSSAPAQQHAEYQTQESPVKKTVLLYSVLPSSQHTHAPSRYHHGAPASQYEPKPSGAPLVYFKVGQSNGHSSSSPYYTTNGNKYQSVPAAAHSQEASSYQYDIKPSPYMMIIQKHENY